MTWASPELLRVGAAKLDPSTVTATVPVGVSVFGAAGATVMSSTIWAPNVGVDAGVMVVVVAALFTVRVKLWVAWGGTPLAAVIVNE